MKTRVFTKEVFYADEPMVKIDRADIARLKDEMCNANKSRIRLCAHKDAEDAVHEMFIIHSKDAYVRPHKHKNKAESLYIMEGSADMVIFDEKGGIKDVIGMGDYQSGRRFYCRIKDPSYHTLLINSDCLIFHEVTKGPFVKSDTIFPVWAPEGDDKGACAEFQKDLRAKLGKFGKI